MLRRLISLVLACVAGVSVAVAGAATATAGGSPEAVAPAPVRGRGELLYTTHCIACHTAQLHWRERKAASDWRRLKGEVRRWQAAARLGWSEDDIVAVARHLNETIYHLPQTGDGVAALSAAGRFMPRSAAAPAAPVGPAAGCSGGQWLGAQL